MTLSKFVALLATSSLHFARADTFHDVFEGAVAPARHRDAVVGVLDTMWARYAHQLAYAVLGKPAPKLKKLRGRTTSITTSIDIDDETVATLIEMAGNDPTKLVEDLKVGMASDYRAKLSEQLRAEFHSAFLSCWHSGATESEAMWRLYSRDTVEGLAIQSSVAALEASLPKERSFTLRAVRYRDQYIQKVYDAPLTRFFVKRRAFRHEREVRAIYVDRDAAKRGDLGVVVPVSLNALINRIVVSPYAPSWFDDVVRQVTAKFDVTAPVARSSLVDEPFHY